MRVPVARVRVCSVRVLAVRMVGIVRSVGLVVRSA
jgi:hypothetical protein